MPSSTEPTGWTVSSIEVSAAGSRGSETEISSQPTTCEVSASVHQPAVRRPGGTRSVTPITSADGERDERGHERRVEQRPGGAAQVLAALAQQRMKPA